MTIEVKDFKDFSVEEIREVLTLIYSEDIQIKKICEYNKEGYFEVGVTTFWLAEDDNGEVEDIEIDDTFYLSNSDISSDDYPVTREDCSTYMDYLRSHGYEIVTDDNKFIKDIKSKISFTETLDDFLTRTKSKVTNLKTSQIIEHIRYKSYDYIARIILRLIQYAVNEFSEELNTSKKPITRKWCASRCPTCNHSFGEYEPCDDGYYQRAYSFERCPYCGQKLEWV